MKPRLLDLFCGRGGWSKAFKRHGWYCVGVDIEDLRYPEEFLQSDVYDLTPEFIDSFDAIVSSPPCEDFARAHLPWLRGDREPTPEAIALLEWSVKLTAAKPNRITECSRFAAMHVPGAIYEGSYALWGDVPLLMPQFRRARRKGVDTGKRPDLRAEIPRDMGDWIAREFTRRCLDSMPPPGGGTRECPSNKSPGKTQQTVTS